MDKRVPLTEEQLRNVISKTIESALLAEGIDEVNWFRRAGNAVRNAYDNAKKADSATATAANARADRAQFNQYNLNNAGAGAQNYKQVSESIDRIVSETLKKYIS